MVHTPQEKMLEVHVSTGGRRFPEESRSNSAVAAINKWLKSVVGFDPVEHRLRLNFKDLL
jgi:hypothetical protein